MKDDVTARIARLTPEKRALLERRLRLGARPADTPGRADRAGPVPTSFGQARQWFLAQLDPTNPTFNKMDAVRVRGALDVAALQHALTALVDRHEVLRTRIVTYDGEPMQLVAERGRLDVPVVGGRAGPGGRLSLDIRRQMAADRLRGFDLVRDVMYRPAVYRLGPEDHVLTRTSHHIAFDKWSAAIANRELSEFYAAAVSGQEPDLAPLPTQYADYAIWQRRALDPATVASHVAFFTAHLAGASRVLELPTDHVRAATLQHAGATYGAPLPQPLVDAVRDLARREGATPFMVLLAAFGMLLSRLARQDEVLVGVPVAGRDRPEFEGLIGLFMNTVVMRLDIRAAPTFRELVARVRSAALGAMGHRDLPFDRLVQELAGPRPRNRTPLFQAMFDYINTPAAEVRLNGVELSPIEVADDTAIYDLTTYVHDHGDSMRTVWEYRSDLFERMTVVRFAQAFEMLLESGVADPDATVTSLPMLSPEGRSTAAALGTGPSRPGAPVATVLEMFDAQVERTARSVAVRDAGGGELEYAALRDRVHRLSHHVRAASAQPGDRVALLLDRSLDFVVAFLGVLAAGCVAVLLDPEHPPSRLRRMLGAADTRLLLTSGSSPIGLADIAQVDVVADAAAIAVHPTVRPSGSPASGDPAYIVFTSGSTGSPKGVLIQHRAVANLVEDALARYALGPEDTVLQFASPGFDTTVEEILPTVCSGARLVLRPHDLFASFAAFSEFVEREAITVLDLPTAWWHAWVDDMDRVGGGVPPSVRLVIVGGEAAAADRWRVWQRLAGSGARWVNTYGPAEATVVVAAFEPPAQWPGPRGRTMPIGQPITNARLLVLDETGQVLPPSMPGELAVEGIPVGLGYVGPEAEANHAFSRSASGAGRYRTGDLARMLEDGTFEYLGRVDTQVKVRGVRVEPAEVEAALRSHPAVREAVVVGSGELSDVILAAHVVAVPPFADASALREHLVEILPGALIPTAWRFHDALPVTPSGKIDRRALGDMPDAEPPITDTLPLAPRSQTERDLAALWTAVLPHAPAGVHDDFFALGGHSLLGVRLISRVSEAFGVDLPLRAIFDAPTIAEMADVVDVGVRAGTSDAGRAP